MERKTNYAGHYTSPEFNGKIKKSKGVILVCGSCEQHGPHLPLDTDNIIGLELALRTAQKTGMLVMPPVFYGQVWSAKGFPGTICLTSSTLKQILKEIVINLEQQQVKNIVLFSGHNGNYPVLKETARELLDEYGWDNIWYFPLSLPKTLLKKGKSALPAGTIHAGEAETSMLLYLRPELVNMEQASREYPKQPEDYPYRPIHWNTFLQTGAFGDATAATPEFGRELCETAVKALVDLIEEFL